MGHFLLVSWQLALEAPAVTPRRMHTLMGPGAAREFGCSEGTWVGGLHSLPQKREASMQHRTMSRFTVPAQCARRGWDGLPHCLLSGLGHQMLSAPKESISRLHLPPASQTPGTQLHLQLVLCNLHMVHLRGVFTLAAQILLQEKWGPCVLQCRVAHCGLSAPDSTKAGQGPREAPAVTMAPGCHAHGCAPTGQAGGSPCASIGGQPGRGPAPGWGSCTSSRGRFKLGLPFSLRQSQLQLLPVQACPPPPQPLRCPLHPECPPGSGAGAEQRQTPLKHRRPLQKVAGQLSGPAVDAEPL